MIQAYMNWSGGKDSSLCLHRALNRKDLQVQSLLTSINSTYNRVSMHGVRRELLGMQALSLGLPLRTIELPEQPDMAMYEGEMRKAVAGLREEGCSHALFGDIFLQDLKRYREETLALEGLGCLFPLWEEDTRALMEEFLGLGYRAVVVCVNEHFLPESFCGRELDASFVADLPPGVDLCGENGEYHSFVYDGPIFRYPVPFRRGERVQRTYDAPAAADGGEAPAPYRFRFCDLLPG